MPLLALSTEILILVIRLHLDGYQPPMAAHLFPTDRLTDYLNLLSLPSPPGFSLDLCLTARTPQERALSRQATNCADSLKALPRIVELSHVCRLLRTIVLGTPSLWASEPLSAPAINQHVLSLAGDCHLEFVSREGLCACIFSDIKPFFYRATRISLTLPSIYIRVDGASLSTSELVRSELVRAAHLTELELRFDGRRGGSAVTVCLLPLANLQSARLLNANFIPAGPSLRTLHVATEPTGPSLPLMDFITAVRLSPSLQDIAVQNSIRESYSFPWEAGIIVEKRIVLSELRRLTCSGSRGLARSLLYCLETPSLADLYIDTDFLLGTTLDPFTRFPSDLATELGVLVHPAETAELLDYARRRASAEVAGAFFHEAPPNIPPCHILPYLALRIIPDTESDHPLAMWPRLMTLAAAEDRDAALRGVSGERCALYEGRGRMCRTFTMRNFYASFPDDEMIAIRQSFPRHLRPAHLGQAASLPLEAYVQQAEAEDVIIHLAIAEDSWVPYTEDDWLFVLADLPGLQVLEVLSRTDAASIRSLAAYLCRDRGNEELRKITFWNTTLKSGDVARLEKEVDGLTTERETADEEEILGHIVWSLNWGR